jgi:hypothetical protein
MKQVLIQLDDAAAARLEEVAPGSRRKRSEFLRGVIARAVHETLELRTREAYRKWPDEPTLPRAVDWADADEAVRPDMPKSKRRAPRKKARR